MPTYKAENLSETTDPKLIIETHYKYSRLVEDSIWEGMSGVPGAWAAGDGGGEFHSEKEVLEWFTKNGYQIIKKLCEEPVRVGPGYCFGDALGELMGNLPIE